MYNRRTYTCYGGTTSSYRRDKYYGKDTNNYSVLENVSSYPEEGNININ